MKITVTVASLKTAINQVISSVKTKSVQPILTSFLLSVDDKELTIRGTDLDLDVSVSVPAFVIDEPGSICVNAKELKSLVATLDKKALVTLDASHDRSSFDAHKRTVSSGGSRRQLEALDAEDFPRNFMEAINPLVILDRQQLDIMLNQVIYCAQSYDSHSFLAGLRLQAVDGVIKACATDGSRIAAYEAPAAVQGKVGNCIIPAAAMAALAKLLTKADTTVTLSVDKYTESHRSSGYASYVRFETGSGSLTARCISGEYPRYEELFPVETTAKLTYNRQELLSAVKQAAAVDKRTWLAVIHEGNVRSGIEGFSADIACDADVEPVPPVALNGNYVGQWLNSIKTDKVEIHLTGSLQIKGSSLKPVMLVDGTPGLRHLLMPVQHKDSTWDGTVSDQRGADKIKVTRKPEVIKAKPAASKPAAKSKAKTKSSVKPAAPAPVIVNDAQEPAAATVTKAKIIPTRTDAGGIAYLAVAEEPATAPKLTSEVIEQARAAVAALNLPARTCCSHPELIPVAIGVHVCSACSEAVA